MPTSSRDISGLIEDLQRGDPATASKLLPIVYRELRRQAALHMRRERPGQTIQTTDLVHEAYLRLVNQPIDWHGRTHFLAFAAIAMRRVLVDRARVKHADKRGGGAAKVELNENLLSAEKSRDLIALDDALNRLAEISPRQSRVVEMRFFGGLSVEEIAAVERISPRTVKLDWSLARKWLHREMQRSV